MSKKEKRKKQTNIDFSKRSATDLATETKFVTNARFHNSENPEIFLSL